MKNKRTQLIVRIGLALGTVISLWFVPWVLFLAWLTPISDTIQEELNKALSHDFEGIIVYVDKAGQAPGFYAAGWHDRDKKIPADPKALFKIASIGKLYEAVTIAKLVNDNRLSLDESLGNYLPELVGRIENAEKITLRMLVQHRSGIPNYTNSPNFWMDPPTNGQESLDLILDQAANFEPGEDYEYSNTNYLLLSQIKERVLEISNFQCIREEILNPLGLKNTFASIQDVNIEKLMSGYYKGVPEDIKEVNYGSMVATAEDVAVFLRALNDGSLFEPGGQEVYSSIYKYEHTGLIPGYQSIAKYHPDIDAVVVQFINTTDFDGYHWSLSEIVYNRIIKIITHNEED
ncbi:serine hydrolase domain-containing protein [uncultured Cyclobacterium sp.]|uniref:serine hydrolase domain-containing protein n=1 Tax=uncultured Cyclobacterium sp. TaxID=453820 RepID=UPI0030EDEAB9